LPGRARSCGAGRAAPQVRADDQRALHQRPQRKVRALLGLAQPVAHGPAHLRSERGSAQGEACMRGRPGRAARAGAGPGPRPAAAPPACRRRSTCARGGGSDAEWRMLRVITASAQTERGARPPGPAKRLRPVVSSRFCARAGRPWAIRARAVAGQRVRPPCAPASRRPSSPPRRC
jgi:hypothetical protein